MPSSRIGRNDPCPCGSGRKYKHCCLRRTPSGSGGAGPAVYGPGRPGSTVPADTLPPAARARPSEGDFEPWTGLTRDDLAAIVAEPFAVPELVTFDLSVPEAGRAPIVEAFLGIAHVLGEHGAPIGEGGGLTPETTRQVVDYIEQEAAADDPPLPEVEQEHDLASLPVARIDAELAGLVARRGGRFVLTARCRRYLERGDTTGLFELLFRAHVTKLDWSSTDPFPNLPALETAWPVTLLLLRRFGHRPMPSQLYADAVLALFGDVQDGILDDLMRRGVIESEPPSEHDQELAHELASLVYTLRSLVRFAGLFGLSAAEPTGDEADEAAVHFALRATPLLHRVLRVNAPQLSEEALLGSALEEPEPFEQRRGPIAGPPADAMPATLANPAREFGTALREAIGDRPFASLDEAREFASAFTDDHNRRPLAQFHGLSPAQMQRLLSAPFEAGDVLRVAEVLPRDVPAPVSLLFAAIADACGERGAKATAKGNLPRGLCRDAFTRHREAGYQVDWPLDLDDLRSEEDFFELHRTRLVAREAGLLRLTHGRWHLTRAARELLAQSGLRGVYPRLLRTYTQRHAWYEHDGYPVLDIVQRSWAFTAYLLHRLAGTERPASDYEDAFLEAFPMTLEEASRAPTWGTTRPADPAVRAERLVRDAFRLRALDRFAAFFGLASITHGPYRADTFDRPALVRAGPALDVAFTFATAAASGDRRPRDA